MRKILFSLLLALPLAAADFEFKEAFADPATRQAALSRLVPQSRDWFFYQALHHQLAGRDGDYRRTMAEWKAAGERQLAPASQEGRDVLENREILLRFDEDPKKAADELIRRNGMSFEDARPDARADEKLPDRLDPALISDAAFEKWSQEKTGGKSYRSYSAERMLADLANLDNFDREKLTFYYDTLDRADHPAIVPFLTKVLKLDNPPPFGLKLGQKLTRTQLDELLAAVPNLGSDATFARRYLTTLLPGAEVDFDLDPAAHAAHLAACRDFVLARPPALNPLKAHVLYYHLRLQRELGKYPPEDFLAYLQLPRQEHPILKPQPARFGEIYVDLEADYAAATGCQPVESDSDLVMDYLQHFLGSADTPDLFKNLIDAGKLKLIHARSRLLAGADPARWGPALDPAELQTLQKETRITFAPGQPVLLPGGAAVKLALDLKNTPDLLVRIFELDLPSWIEREGSEPPVDLDLEGLVPHHEKRLSFAQAPLAIHRELLDLPELAGAGAWIVECVSKEVSARALVRKGRLIPFVEREARGQSVRIFDESGALLKDASVALGTEVFSADAVTGKILIPDKAGSTRSKGVVRQGKLAAPLALEARRDAITLEARFHIDREQLLADQQASLFLRLRLNNHGQEIPLEWIDKPALVMQATLASGVTTERVIGGDLKLAPRMFVPFQVPADAMILNMRLSGSVTPREGDEPVALEAVKTWQMNGIISSGRIAAGFFTRDTDGYRLEVRGRNGEPLASRPVNFEFHHRLYDEPVTCTLRSDEQGRVALGALPDIMTVTAKSPDISEVSYGPAEDEGWADLPHQFQIAVGDEIRLPLVRPMAAPERTRVSLVEWRDEALLRDRFDKLAIENKRLVLRGLSAGDYRLLYEGHETIIRVCGGVDRDGLLVAASRIVPRRLPALPVVASATPEAGLLVVKLDGASPATRVSLLGRRYLHDGPSDAALQPFANPQAGITKPGFKGNDFLESKRLSDEMRYILDRRALKTFPGSMLPRTGLLVNRWSEDDVVQGKQSGEGGGRGTGSGMGRGSNRMPAPSEEPADRGDGSGDEATLDFLANPAVLKLDLPVAADGTVQVPAADFAQCQYIEIVAADTSSRHHLELPLVPTETPVRDRRLAKPLDAQKYHVGTRRAAALLKDAEAKIENVTDADWRAFTTLAEAHAFLFGATKDNRLNDFLPVLDWPSLDEKAKLAFYSDHASHELHLFLARKDPDFFSKHVKPLLAEKREPTVIDNILLGRDLADYLRPYAWQRLNAAEKALLAQAMPEVRERIARELKLRWELEAPTPEQETRLFTQTLRGKEMAAEDVSMASASGQSTGTQYLMEKLRDVVIPIIDFEDTSVEEAIDFLRLRARELDVREVDPTKKGINFVIRKPRASSGDALLDADAEGGLSGVTDPGALRIKELRLRNVPLAEALKYIADATKLRYKVDDFAVTLVPATETDEDLFTRTFTIPPDFIARLGDGEDSGVDPFSGTSYGDSGAMLKARHSIADVLRQKGVSLPPGSSATLVNGKLIVRNTPTNIDLIEQLTASLHSAPDPEMGADPFSSSGILPPLEEEDTAAELPNSIGEPADPFGGGESGGSGAMLSSARFAAKATWSAKRDKTRLWRESNYYRYHGNPDEKLIPMNRFWLDLAEWDGKGSFISPNFNACTRGANEALFCLAMLDLPFKADRPETSVEGSTLRVKAREPMLLFYKDTRETQKIAADAPVLVRQIFHRLDDRFRTVEGRQVENSITGDFVAGVAYGAAMVVTNPSGAGRRIDVLAQIPAGAIPLSGKPVTTSETYELKPYGVQNLGLAFYFPQAGEYPLYPLQVSEGDTVLARGEARVLKVVAEPPPAPADSWPALARDATNEAVLERLKIANLRTVDLRLIRWRLHDRAFFDEASRILRERLHYSADVAVYGLFHGEVAAMRELIENSSLSTRLGEWLDSPLIRVRPLVHRGWETLEFDPLVNPRAHRFADKERLTHEQALAHYTALLDTLAWKPALDPEDQLALAAHLLLQDRVDEALARFDAIDSNKLPATMAYDYIGAVAQFYRSKPEEARAFAVLHADLPPGQWKERFDAIRSQADEIVALQQPRAAEEQKPKEEAPSLDLALAADGKLLVKQRRLDKTLLQLFSVDLEMMFSKDPFLAGEGAALPGIRANETREVALAGPETAVDLPETFRHGNVLVAAKSGSTKVLKVLDSRALEIARQPEQRTLQVFDSASRLPLPQCYVKVYVQGPNGEAVFHKDGYTDLRGKFDYLSHTGSEIGEIRRIAVLVNHPEKGARVEVFDL